MRPHLKAINVTGLGGYLGPIEAQHGFRKAISALKRQPSCAAIPRPDSGASLPPSPRHPAAALCHRTPRLNTARSALAVGSPAAEGRAAEWLPLHTLLVLEQPASAKARLSGERGREAAEKARAIRGPFVIMPPHSRLYVEYP